MLNFLLLIKQRFISKYKFAFLKLRFCDIFIALVKAITTENYLPFGINDKLFELLISHFILGMKIITFTFFLIDIRSFMLILKQTSNL